MKNLLSTMILFATMLRASAPDSVSVGFSLPPLSVIQETAIKNSPVLKRESASMKMREQELNMTKKEWLRSFSLEGSTQYGSYGDQSVNKLYLGNRVGASVRISLEEIFSYGSKSEKAEANIVMAEYNQKTLERELREVITSRYVKIQTTIRLVEIAMQGYNNSSIAKQNAELKFQSGELPVYDYSRILDLLTTASMTLERTRGELQLEWMVLEEIVGSPLNSLGSKQ